MTTYASSSSKEKATRSEGWVDSVALPTFLTHTGYFEKSALADLLFIAPGTTESRIRVQADPTRISAPRVERLVSEATREWLEENLQPADELDPETYLFESPQREAVSTAWLEAIYQLPIRDDHDLVMDFDQES